MALPLSSPFRSMQSFRGKCTLSHTHCGQTNARTNHRELWRYTRTQHVLLMALFNVENIYSILFVSCMFMPSIFCHVTSCFFSPFVKSVHALECLMRFIGPIVSVFVWAGFSFRWFWLWVIETFMGKWQVRTVFFSKQIGYGGHWCYPQPEMELDFHFNSCMHTTNQHKLLLPSSSSFFDRRNDALLCDDDYYDRTAVNSV